MSLKTPPKIRSLQESLYGKAKQQPICRFHFLYDKVYREDILAHAYALSRTNAGAPGVDGQTFADVEAYGKEYAPKAQALIKKMGGKLLVGTNNVTTLEGAPAKRIAMHQWESMEKAKAWQSSNEYKENRKIGDKYAKFRILLVEGMPQ